MTYLLDTNVVCEATAREPDPHVLAWCETHAHECVLSAVTLGEILKGIHLMPAGKRKNAIAAWAERVERDFRDALLPLDAAVFGVWGKFYAKHESKGFNMGVLDSLIAATALHHDLVVVTRNTRDFPAEVRTLNPWNA
ncbi:type II toxin-antitoxin system VapC family toxin [Luteolibacter sp. LG18]|uniref:type II toxin-antitoxin system VapC family toxin n=1 Tax=Luteolibacter sp. LG18 TaxID=2819286 RepID=UPI002B2E7906|nr:ribonuclease VapC [Luteolibacter sp. LG18]